VCLFFVQAEDGIRYHCVTGVQTCALPIYAPIYGWALLVSGWVRRATFLWAILPLLAISFFEKITFNTSHFASMLKDRVLGFAPQAFASQGHAVPQLTPGRYLSTPGLWLGLVFAAVFIAAAIRLRRYRGPL